MVDEPEDKPKRPTLRLKKIVAVQKPDRVDDRGIHLPHLNPGDVIVARFPGKEAPGFPGPKPRPCIVESYCPVTGDISGVYVTKESNHSNRGGLVVDDPKRMKAAGFKSPSRIVPTRVERFKNNRSYVVQNFEGETTTGRLTDEDWERLLELLAEARKVHFLTRVNFTELLLPSLLAITRGWVSEVQGVFVERDGVCTTVRIGEMVVNYWPEDQEHPDQVLGLDRVTREMMKADALMTAGQRLRCLGQMADEERKAS